VDYHARYVGFGNLSERSVYCQLIRQGGADEIRGEREAGVVSLKSNYMYSRELFSTDR